MTTARRMQLTLLSAIIVGGLAASGALMYSLHRNVASYDAIFETEVAQQDAARAIQVTFTKQLQHWQNMLLRGADYEAFQIHAKGFHDEERLVHELSETLDSTLMDDTASKTLREFVAAHDTMKAGYAKAETAFGATQGTKPAEADTRVKGLDRAPTHLIDTLVDRLEARAVEAREQQAAAAATEQKVIGAWS